MGVSASLIWVVEHIRSVGYEARFAGRIYVYYDIAEFQYWPHPDGMPRSTDPEVRTILINRAVKKPSQLPGGL